MQKKIIEKRIFNQEEKTSSIFNKTHYIVDGF